MGRYKRLSCIFLIIFKGKGGGLPIERYKLYDHDIQTFDRNSKLHARNQNYY